MAVVRRSRSWLSGWPACSVAAAVLRLFSLPRCFEAAGMDLKRRRSSSSRRVDVTRSRSAFGVVEAEFLLELLMRLFADPPYFDRRGTSRGRCFPLASARKSGCRLRKGIQPRPVARSAHGPHALTVAVEGEVNRLCHGRDVENVVFRFSEHDAYDLHRHVDHPVNGAVGRIAHDVAIMDKRVPQIALSIDGGPVRGTATRSIDHCEGPQVRHASGGSVVMVGPHLARPRFGEKEILPSGFQRGLFEQMMSRSSL